MYTYFPVSGCYNLTTKQTTANNFSGGLITMSNKFNWSNFEADFLKSILNSEKTKDSLRPTFDTDESFELAPFIESIVLEPDRKFIIDYRNEIDFYFLKNNPDLIISVFGKGKENPNSLLRKITAMPLGEMLVNKYITALGRVGRNDFDYFVSEYTKPITIDLSIAKYNDISLYDFQETAIDKLNDFANSKKHKSGLLVMPTGSGKTRTAVHFLLHDMVSQGYQVIWLTHRHMLIDQAAEQFASMSNLISDKNPDAKTFRFMCSSGKHGTIKAASKKQDVMILSVQTAVRNLAYIRKSLKEKVIIVVDEAHHTVATSYKRIVSDIRKRRPNALLLGLTATPIRYTDEATTELQTLFERNIIYSIDMNTLIANGTLANPEFTRVETNIDFEPEITNEEAKRIDRFGELPESVINRIAQSKRRNDIILEQYFNHDYGRTLIFALNIVHAQMLCDDFKKRKVRCECIYSGKPDNQAIIKAFKDNKIDVLINVNILSEGSDVPNVETVFLTRPTQSETLLVQMIGRGMRGKAAGGTECVKIVDFIDKWEIFSRWLIPEFLFKATTFESEDVKENERNNNIVMIPWKDIRAIYRSLGSVSGYVSESQSLPVGWFSLDNDEQPYTLLVFKNQLAGYNELFRNKKEIIENVNITAQQMINRCFGGMVEKPSIHNIDALLSYLRTYEQQPHLFHFKQRIEVDPICVADEIRENKKDIFDVCAQKNESYPEMIDQLYGGLEEYRKRVFNILNYNQTDIVAPTEMPIELVPFTMDKPYDLQALYEEVKIEMAQHLGECVNDTGKVEWTDKPYKRYYGVFFGNTGDIQINCILNSSKVPREVIKYLLYHEMLHRKYYYHDKLFRCLEHKYPNYTSYEKFLDYDFGDYNLVY